MTSFSDCTEGSLSAYFEDLFFRGAGKDRQSTVVTVIGSGGKTSLIWRLAASFAASRSVPRAASRAASGNEIRILVTPTTKMFVPGEKLYDEFCNGIPPRAVPGITLAGLFNETSGKLESLPPQALESIAGAYDLVLVEGDGSRELPLKAWADNEPVVPSFTNYTIGVLPLWPLGEPVSEKLIHRLPIFLALTGAAPGEILKPEHILALITGRAAPAIPGLFAKARGKKILFFNQIEDDAAFQQALEIAGLLPLGLRNDLGGIIAGSVRQDWAKSAL